MKARLARLAWMVTLGVLVLVLVGGWLGNKWLESAGGRRLLERELSQAIGSPVRLSGSYRLRMLPRIVIAGRQFSVGAASGEAPITVASFRAAIGLVPLLRQTLRIDSIELSGGRVDLDGAARLFDLSDATGAAPMTFPAVAALELRDFRLSSPGRTIHVHLRRLRLSDLRPGHRAPLVMKADVLRQEEIALGVRIEGSLRVAVDPLSAELDAGRITWRSGAGRPLELSGAAQWRAPDALIVEVSYRAGKQGVSAALETGFDGGVTGHLAVRWEDTGTRQAATAELAFRQRDDILELAPVSLDLAGQPMAGSGCIMFAGEPSLHLRLHADEVDLDRLRQLIPESAAGGTGDDGLPSGLAIQVTAARATVGGAAAQGIRVLIGAEPACPPP